MLFISLRYRKAANWTYPAAELMYPCFMITHEGHIKNNFSVLLCKITTLYYRFCRRGDNAIYLIDYEL